jgi:hypothetical protein
MSENASETLWRGNNVHDQRLVGLSRDAIEEDLGIKSPISILLESMGRIKMK